MKINLGLVERVIRAVLGVVLIGLAAAGVVTGTWMYVVGGVGVVLLATSAISFCPLWALLGISTVPKGKGNA